jgi:hypothetical protein
MGRTACTEPQCLYKSSLYLLPLLFTQLVFSSGNNSDVYKGGVRFRSNLSHWPLKFLGILQSWESNVTYKLRRDRFLTYPYQVKYRMVWVTDSIAKQTYVNKTPNSSTNEKSLHFLCLSCTANITFDGKLIFLYYIFLCTVAVMTQ